MCLKKAVLKKTKFDYYLGFTSCFCYFSTLNFSKHGCNEGEEEEPYFAFRIIHVFVHACEACSGHSSIAFARRMGEVRNFEFAL